MTEPEKRPQNPLGDASLTASPATENRLTPIVDRTLFLASGADVDGFLQGQLCSDLRQLTAERAQLSGFSSPKGRLLAVMLLRRQVQDVTLEIPSVIVDAVVKRLRMFVLRAKVELRDVSAERPALGLSGPDAAALLQHAGLPAPAAVLDCAQADGVIITRCPGTLPRFELRGDAAGIGRISDALSADTQPGDASSWRLLDVLAGVPNVYAETQDRFVAQMVNLDLLGGIAFDKGCYTGQEVIARLHYLGNLKRRMFLLDAASPAPAPGTPIHDAADDGKHVGDVVDAADAGDGRSAIAAVLQLSHAQSAELRLGAAEGPTLSKPRAFAPGQPPL